MCGDLFIFAHYTDYQQNRLSAVPVPWNNWEFTVIEIFCMIQHVSSLVDLSNCSKGKTTRTGGQVRRKSAMNWVSSSAGVTRPTLSSSTSTLERWAQVRRAWEAPPWHSSRTLRAETRRDSGPHPRAHAHRRHICCSTCDETRCGEYVTANSCNL